MALEITGKVIKTLPEQTGESNRGPWKKGGFVIETESNFPKKICCVVWGDLLNQVNNLKEGERIKASIDIESREYNERWYTDVKVWRIESAGAPASAPSGSQTTTPADNNMASGPDDAPEESADDLPF